MWGQVDLNFGRSLNRCRFELGCWGLSLDLERKDLCVVEGLV